MSIKVLFFASLRESLNKADAWVDASLAPDVQRVWQLSTQNQPLPNNILIAVNQTYADLQTPVKAGDEVAFFPPVTGG
jgi:molybdopterin synthase sulfur carrier subunit